ERPRVEACPPSAIDIVGLFPIIVVQPTFQPTERQRYLRIFRDLFSFSFLNRVRCKPVGPPPGEGADGRRSLTSNLSDGSRRDCPFHSSPLGFLRQCALCATVLAHVMRGIT